MNSLVYAYMGDAVYEMIIRSFFVEKQIGKVETLQKKVISYVSAKGQVKMLEYIEPFLTEKEQDIVRRGRNYKQTRHPKNTDLMTYKKATGFEALLGYLYFEDKERLEDIRKIIVQYL